MVRAAAGWSGRAGRARPPPPSSASACPSAADAPDDAGAGAGARARARARVAAALVGGGDPQELPDLVAGGGRGRERRAPGRPGGTAGEEAAWGDARPASGRAGPRFSLHPVRPAATGLNETHASRARKLPPQGPGVRERAGPGAVALRAAPRTWPGSGFSC